MMIEKIIIHLVRFAFIPLKSLPFHINKTDLYIFGGGGGGNGAAERIIYLFRIYYKIVK